MVYKSHTILGSTIVYASTDRLISPLIAIDAPIVRGGRRRV